MCISPWYTPIHGIKRENFEDIRKQEADSVPDHLHGVNFELKEIIISGLVIPWIKHDIAKSSRCAQSHGWLRDQASNQQLRKLYI